MIDGEKEEDSISRINGRPSITIDIQKSQDANIVDTGRGIMAALDALKKRLPADVEIRVANSTAETAERAVNRVKSTIVEGGLLTVLIVFLFLHSWRSTIITGLTLPIAVIATFIALYAFGFTLNFLTLMALSLCIGLLIDDAIVVRENIVRHLGLGKNHHTAAREGTDEIGLAVMATTFAIVAVFVPIAFMSGLIGRFFFQFGVTVAVAVLVSLFVSFTLDPMLSAVWHDPPGSRFARVPWLGRFMEKVEQGIEWLHTLYGEILEWALGHRKSVIAIAVVTFLASFAIVPLVGTEFVPQADEGFISLRLNTPVGSSLEYTDTKVQQVEAALKSFDDDRADDDHGRFDGGPQLCARQPEAHRQSAPQEDAEGDRGGDPQAVEADSRDRARVRLRPAGVGQPARPRSGELTTLINQFARKGRQDSGHRRPGNVREGRRPGAVDPAQQRCRGRRRDHRAAGRRDDPAAARGRYRELLARTRRPELRGQRAVAEGQPAPRRGLEQPLSETTKNGPDGEMRMVPLRQVAEIVETTSPQIIKRQELQRRVALYANVEGRPSGDANKEVQKIIKETTLPPGYRFDVGGQAKDMEESFQAALAALGLAVIFIYLILASQFASFTQPFAIMASLPFSLIGVFLALLLTGTTLNLFSMIGFIMLMGLVTKNAILLVDFANRARRAGASLHDSLLQAGQVRLRPIMMTTAAMIGGMMPLAIGYGEGGEVQAPMGRAIIGGVITSTLLTLVVVPVLYTYLDALHERRRKRREAKMGAMAAHAAPVQGD